MPPPELIAAVLIVIFLGIGLHEYAHAKLADLAGDPTPAFYGRVSLNLFRHFDPLGSLMILFTAFTGFGIGWGRPVPMNPQQMRNPRWDHFVAVLGGPVSNLIQAALYAIVMRLTMLTGTYEQLPTFVHLLLYFGVSLNLTLCFFNLIPLGPLDGMWLVGTFMNDKSRLQWTRWNLTFGQFVFLGAVLLSQLSPGPGIIGLVIRPPMVLLFRFLTGVPFPF
ncbi:MAG: site-2 protease family protein [Fimbriimonadaceae bacterium]|nr:site-2 protease family protein [Fimbriimonadaceae bacterium]QYK55483.1 MAG: site-2 protease family protein [Fimbriimonadaceae bacterium]